MTDKNPFDDIPVDSEAASVNPFDQINDTDPEGPSSSTFGALARGAAGGTLPAVGGIAAAARGARLGAMAGALIPGLGETGIGEAGGAIVGGLIGGFGGGWAAGKAQDYAISKLPDSWKDPIEAQEKADVEQHPYASFAGGLVPFALTMSPGSWARQALPANATAMQRLMAHPATAHLFGGAVQGGIELGQEAVTGDYDWRKVAMSTGFGLVFNSPNRIGRWIEGRSGPTIAQAHDTKVAGEGVTEEVFQGTQEQDPKSAMAAQDAARAEAPEQPQPDLHAVARRMEPELFAQWDELNKRRDSFRQWLGELEDPQASPVTRAHLRATEEELGELQPQIAAAYRRAADHAGAETVEPAKFRSLAEMIAANDQGRAPQPIEQAQQGAQPPSPVAAANETPATTPPSAGVPEPAKPIAEQKAFIAEDVTKQLIAAGRPRDEAEAAGHLIAARYETRAGLFHGSLGSAEDLYRREGAKIVGPGKTFAPPAPAPPSAPSAPAAKPQAGDALAKVAANREEVAKVEAARVPEPAETTAVQADKRVGDLTPAQQKKQLPEFSDAAVQPHGEGEPAGVFMFEPTKLNVDASRFQFKSGGDEYGVTGALRSVSKWDAAKAQAIIVWEQTDGKLFVADGHQRAGLARRLTEQGKAEGIKLPGILYREADGVTADDMRAIAAVTNIANGSGSAIDGAKVLRSRPELMDGSLPLSAGKGQQAAALARLADEPFRMVVNDVVPEHQGAIVGELIPNDPDRQIAAMKAIARFEPKNVEETSALVQRVAQAELAKANEGKQISMFGDLETPESTAGEEMRIVGRAIKDLKKDKALFARVVANAERIEQTGSHIERGSAKSIVTDADVFAKTLASDAYAAGPIRDELVIAAKDLKDGKGSLPNSSARILAAIRRQVEENGAYRTRDSERAGRAEGAEEAGVEAATAQGEVAPQFEAGAEGKPQQLIPGVEPVTDRDKLQAQVNAPMRGGNADLQHEGLFGDAQNQRELFQTKEPPTPEEHLVSDLGLSLARLSQKTKGDAKLGAALHDSALKMMEALGLPADAFGIGRRFGLVTRRMDDWGGQWDNSKAIEVSTKGNLKDTETTLAHEWWHAFDNYFGSFDRTDRRFDYRYMSDRGSETPYATGAERGGGVRSEVADAFDNLRETILKGEDGEQSAYVHAAKKADQEEGSEYWSQPIEVTARAFEDYIAEKTGMKHSGAWRIPAQDRSAVFSAFDALFKALKVREAEGGGKELYQGAGGSIRFRDNDPRPIIRMMANADASTFIHESGHDFLEQIKRDAAHEAAPDQLRKDWETTKSWLGAADGNLKTKHHEKFARGFEQYMREGVAPSRELAGIFARFKSWLLNIYQTIKGLGSPINDDIRGVFDRLLAEEPQRTVIAPDVERGKTLAGLHEEEAAAVPPAEAEPAMARVENEAERHETELHPEVLNGLAPAVAKVEAEAAAEQQPAGANDAGPENSAGAAEAGHVGESGPRPEPDAGLGPRGEGSVEKLGGGGSARPESGGVSGSEQRPVSGQGSGNGIPFPGPTTTFAPAEPKFIDKAGNIRIDNLTTREDVAQAIRDAADANDDFIGDRRGVISDGQVTLLAEALGMDETELSKRKLGQAFNAEQVMAARKLLLQSATDVSAAMKKAANGTDEDVMAYAQAKDRHQMIQAQVAGITAEAGRALRAFHSIVGQESTMAVDQFIKQATGKTLFQMRQEAKLGAQLETPQQVSKFMHDSEKRGFSSSLLEYWINGLISGPATHTTYMIGNMLLAFEKSGPETLIAAGIGAARQAMGRKGAIVRAGEAGAQMRAAGSGLAPALKASAEAFRTGQTTLLPGESGYDSLLPVQFGLGEASKYDPKANYRDAMESSFSIARGIRDGIISGASLLKAGGVPGEPTWGRRYTPGGAIPDYTFRGVGVAPVGTLIRGPSRFIAAIHSLFRSMNYSMENAALAYRQAAEEGLDGMALAQRAGELYTNPTPEMMQQSVHEATELTLMGKGGKFTNALSRLTNTQIFGLPLFKFVDPFVKISSNVFEQSLIKRTPMGWLSGELRRDLLGDNGTIAQDRAQARMLAGTALCVGFGTLAAQGLVSGSGPKDPKKAAMWRLGGNQAHSVRIGDTWYDLHRLGPLGMLMGMSADLYDVIHKVDEGKGEEAAAHLLHAVTQNILDESFMRGPAELIQAIEDPDRHGQSYIQNFLASFTPYSVGMSQIARASDPYTRQAGSIIDAIKRKIPGMSEDLLPRRDIWGEPMPSADALIAPGVTALYERQVSTDPVNLAMLRLGIAPAQVSRHIRNVELTDQERDDYSRVAGRMAKMNLNRIVQSPMFENWPPHVQHDVIVTTIRQSREAASGMMMMKYPHILRDAVQNKLKKIRGENIEEIE